MSWSTESTIVLLIVIGLLNIVAALYYIHVHADSDVDGVVARALHRRSAGSAASGSAQSEGEDEIYERLLGEEEA